MEIKSKNTLFPTIVTALGQSHQEVADDDPLLSG
jgi:hypothetical protein